MPAVILRRIMDLFARYYWQHRLQFKLEAVNVGDREVRDAIAQMIVPGSSLIISDQGLGDETGEGTDFIVVTR